MSGPPTLSSPPPLSLAVPLGLLVIETAMCEARAGLRWTQLVDGTGHKVDSRSSASVLIDGEEGQRGRSGGEVGRVLGSEGRRGREVKENGLVENREEHYVALVSFLLLLLWWSPNL